MMALPPVGKQRGSSVALPPVAPSLAERAAPAPDAYLTAYPRNGELEFASSKDSLLAAGGLRMVPAEPLGARQPIVAGVGLVWTDPASSGFMPVGSRGYIGYDANHVRAKVGRRDKSHVASKIDFTLRAKVQRE